MGLRLLQHTPQGGNALQTLLSDSMLTLPLVTRRDVNIFYEHLKRLCCVEAPRRSVVLIGLSKSHGLPGIEHIEDNARAVAGTATGETLSTGT